MTLPPDWTTAARAQWQWRGQARPPFADLPAPGQVSVWDYPRSPRIATDTREVVVRWRDVEVARSRRALCVMETSHPPSFYLPWHDVAVQLFEPAPGESFCEWKGPAQYWRLVDGARRTQSVAWSYPESLAGAEVLADCVAFYPAMLACTVDGTRVQPQPGGFYGGWVTSELVGPFKGQPGSESW